MTRRIGKFGGGSSLLGFAFLFLSAPAFSQSAQDSSNDSAEESTDTGESTQPSLEEAPTPEAAPTEPAPSEAVAEGPTAEPPPPDVSSGEGQPPASEGALEAEPGSDGDEITDAELEQFMAENNLAEGGIKGPTLDIYGFADFSYWQFLLPDDSPWRFIYSNEGTFAIGNLNVYLDARLTRTLRSLMEFRFTYLPFGQITNFDTTIQRDVNQSSDYTRNERDIVVGGVNIARAYLEWEAHQLFRVKFGQWLTPYGIWNVDHGTPVIIPAARPFVIDEQLLPESQVGILAEGRWELPQGWGIEYGAGISNGRGPIDRFMDMDSNRALTGRLRATYGGFGDLSFGVSGYMGQYTYKQSTLTADASGQLATVDTILEQYDEVSFAADARWVLGGLHLQSELMVNERRYTEEGRTPGGAPGSLVPDFRRWGVYGLAGYRFDWLGIMPYFLAEFSPVPTANITELPRKTVFLTGGVNIRPVPALVIKLGYAYVFFPENRPGTFDEHPVQRLMCQLAWAF